MKAQWKITSAAGLVLALAAPALAGPGFPPGWSGGIANAKYYDFGTAPMAGAVGKQAAYIKAKPGAPADDFFAMNQCVAATDYSGQRVRVSARFKTVEASAEQLFMRVDGDSKVLGFYNNGERHVGGTTDWKRYDAVLDVPAESKDICYGFILAGGKGEAWADNFMFEKVDKSVPVSASASLKKAPVNLNFDQ